MTHTGELQCGDCKYIYDTPDVNQYGITQHDWRCSIKDRRIYPAAFICKEFAVRELLRERDFDGFFQSFEKLGHRE
jgi:hypothetical protein